MGKNVTEAEKIAYAKMFIDKLANGINPLDDSEIPEGDLINNVRLSRCFFYVSGILGKAVERERRKEVKPKKLPFSITPEELGAFTFSKDPLSPGVIARKLNWLVREETASKRMSKLSYRQINAWLLSIGLIEYKEYSGKQRLFPTEEGEEMGITSHIWTNYGRSIPVILLNEDAQHLVIDNLDAVMATDPKKRGSDLAEASDEEAEE